MRSAQRQAPEISRLDTPSVVYKTGVRIVKTLAVSDVRNHLPAIIGDVAESHESVVVTRYGKPVAKIVPCESGEKANAYPLRGRPIAVARDFDKPMSEMWSAFAVGEGHAPYGGAPKGSGRKKGKPR